MDPAELGLQPLIITPEIAARARAELAGSQAPPFDLAAPPRDPPASSSTTALQDINTLQGMFPDFDAEVLSSVLATCDGSMELAVTSLLEMGGSSGGGDGGGAAGAQADQEEADRRMAEALSASINSEQDLERVLFQEFATDLEQQLGETIPPHIRSDPARLDEYIRQKFDAALQKEDSKLMARADQLMKSSAASGVFAARGGKAGFLERMRKKWDGVGMSSDKQESLLGDSNYS